MDEINQQNIKDYIAGNWHWLKDQAQLLPKEYSDMVKARQEVCKTCPMLVHQDHNPEELKCGKCGCLWPTMTYTPRTDKCLLNKWIK